MSTTGNLDCRIARRILNTPLSPIRAASVIAQQPGVISLAGGWPNPQLFDTEGITHATEQVLSFGPVQSALQYGPTEGELELRSLLAELTRYRGLDARPEDIVVTTGAQQAIDLVTRVLIEPGDVVLVERPTYASALTTFRLAEADIVGIDCDSEGLLVEHLKSTFMDYMRQGRPPRLLYTIPNYANPTGALMPEARRLEIAEFATKTGLVVLEDDPYGELHFTGAPPPPPVSAGLADHSSENSSIYVSSLSKIVAPGLRIGWCVLPTELRRPVTVVKAAADLQGSSLDQYIATAYISSGRLSKHLSALRQQYRDRCLNLAQALRNYAEADLSFQVPHGGMFIWGRLNCQRDATKHLSVAASYGVAYVPGSGFYPANPDESSVRLSFAGPDSSELPEAARRLGQSLRHAPTELGDQEDAAEVQRSGDADSHTRIGHLRDEI